MKVSKAIAFTNARKKFYFDSAGNKYLWNTLIFAEPTFKRSGFELVESLRKTSSPSDSSTSDKDTSNDFENKRKSFNRAKNNLFDLLMCNTDCDYFCTLTFDEKNINRYNYSDIIKKLNCMLDNFVRRKNLKYILVPELHKDGAIHFHGLINAEVLRLEKAVSPYTGKLLTTNKGKDIYNIKSFKLGFSTAVKIGDSETERSAVAKYCYKYIIKSHGVKVGGRYYLSGGDLKRPIFELCDIDYFSVDVEPFTLPHGVEFKILKA